MQCKKAPLGSAGQVLNPSSGTSEWGGSGKSLNTSQPPFLFRKIKWNLPDELPLEFKIIIYVMYFH